MSTCVVFCITTARCGVQDGVCARRIGRQKGSASSTQVLRFEEEEILLGFQLYQEVGSNR